jgi:TonB family protein
MKSMMCSASTAVSRAVDWLAPTVTSSIVVLMLGTAAAQPADVAGTATATAASAAEDDSAPRDPLVTRFEADIEFNRLVEAQQFKDAVQVGSRMIDLTEQEFGKSSKQAANAYTRYGNAQRAAGDHDAAEKSFLHAIDVYRQIDGPFTADAIAPLTDLGDNYHEAGEDLKAVSVYDEARATSRRTAGLLNEGQITLLDRLSRSFLALNQPLESDQRQLEELHLSERNWPIESDQGLAAVYKYAGYLHDNGRFQEERDQYQQATRIIREHYGKDDVRLIEPLAAIGNSFRSQRLPDSQGANALHEALTLITAEKNPDPKKLAQLLTDVGDWEVAFAKTPYDGAHYQRAWQILGTLRDGDALRSSWFGRGPNYVLREPISQRLLSQQPNAPMGHVLVKFDVDRGGVADNVVVVESQPAGMKDEAVVRHVHRSRFRPQIIDGELVPAEGVALLFNFRFDPDSLSDAERAKYGL